MDGLFTVVLERPKKKVSKIELGKSSEEAKNTKVNTRDMILKLIADNNEITTPELAKKTRVTLKGVEYHSSKLKEEGHIERIGPAKGGVFGR